MNVKQRAECWEETLSAPWGDIEVNERLNCVKKTPKYYMVLLICDFLHYMCVIY